MRDGFVIKSSELASGEIEKINRYTRREYKPEEVYAFSLVLCDNEIDRDFERFSVSALEKLCELFLGKTCIFDHERKSANQTARIFHTELKTERDERTQADEEYVQLAARAYLPRTDGNRETIELIESGILKEVSISCSVEKKVCSICGKEQCSHRRGKSYNGQTAHRILLEPTDAYECSFVAVPAQRSAGVTKGYGKEENMELEKLLEASEEGITLSKAQAKELGERLAELEELAGWGKEYRQSMESGVLKYSALLHPELPTSVMRSAVKGLSLSELSAMEKAYRSMAGKTVPLKPQLLPKQETAKKAENTEFRI